jgi:rod shape-determining protein MreD
MPRGYDPRLERAPQPAVFIAIPIASVMVGSLLPALIPTIATMPLTPPIGLLLLMGWRFLVRDVWPAWIGLPLGLFDDLVSGQPLGSAACIWTVLLLMMELVDRRMMWRDYKQDWQIGAALIAIALFLGMLFSNISGGGMQIMYIVPQMIVSALALPLSVRLCSILDRFRWRL